jgi:hypothetical protein
MGRGGVVYQKVRSKPHQNRRRKDYDPNRHQYREQARSNETPLSSVLIVVRAFSLAIRLQEPSSCSAGRATARLWQANRHG